MRNDYERAIPDGGFAMQDGNLAHKAHIEKILGYLSLAGGSRGGPTPEHVAVGAAATSLEASTLIRTDAMQRYTELMNARNVSSPDNIRRTVMDVADKLRASANAWKPSVDFARQTLGNDHPMTQEFQGIHNEAVAHYNNFVDAWDIKNDIAFEDMMHKSKLNPNQFG